MTLTAETFCQRWYAAPPELVFRAFTEPTLLERWFCPSPEIAVRVEECDVRPGGKYRFVYHFPDGSAVPVVGEYQVVSAPKRLVFTWTWEPPDPWVGIVTLVTIDFLTKDGGTQVNVRHEKFSDQPMKQRHEDGWTATLDRLVMLLSKFDE